FKRDKLGNATEADRDLIRAGSDSAHGGDCVTDSSLYGANGRRDTSTFETLYGLHPAIVPTILYPPTIDTLNLHASILANNKPPAELRLLRAGYYKAIYRSS
ncbi:hypothetical protein V8E54_011004, partial [Elaphomyces granulatus]